MTGRSYGAVRQHSRAEGHLGRNGSGALGESLIRVRRRVGFWGAVVVALAILVGVALYRSQARVIAVDVRIDGRAGDLETIGKPECFEFRSPAGLRSAGVRGVRFRNVSPQPLHIVGRFTVTNGSTVLGDEGSGTLEVGKSGFGVWRSYDLTQIHRDMEADRGVRWVPASIVGIQRCTLTLSVSSG